MLTKSKLSILPITILLSACVSIPSGPSVMTLPGTGKSFDEFRSDDYQCRQFAYEQIGGVTPKQSSLTSGAKSAAIGAGLGAATGALVGGGEGAAIGAGAGLLMGGLAGSGTSRTSGYEGQRRYDMSYIQCMYANGHRVPVSGKITRDSYNSRNNSRTLTPPPDFTPPPPPPGNPPPPPLR